MILILCIPEARGQVNISVDGNDPDPSAMLEVKSDQKGFLPPRLTTLQRNAIVSPAEGLLIYNTDLNCIEFYTGQEKGWFCPCSGHASPDCGLLVVNGSYYTGQALTTPNTVTIQVDAFSLGGYELYSNQVNGFHFHGSGVFTQTGLQIVTLTGSGTPLVNGLNDFTLYSGTETCEFQVTVQNPPEPLQFRSGIFLHHSTGANIWGPNGSSTSIPQEMIAYNTTHGYTGDEMVMMDEEWWAPSDNEWATQHAFFEDPDPYTGIGYYLPGNRIIVIKSCFPSSAMVSVGSPEDTLTPYLKSVYNYKWHWRHILQVAESLPENFFVLWTNAPLEPNSTNSSEAALSRDFCKWAKDTLAAGLDAGYSTFPPNAYVFDFFSKLTGPDGMMLSSYAASPGDSHPNAEATQLIAPQFVQEIFDAAISYEATYMATTPVLP
ncbi:MAG: hypothetical protein JXA23_03445 [Bacteroidales bacterium]|nr:hypothetical protein [Bacteroidales bacterium]